MDFYTISVKEKKDGPPVIYPDWKVGRSKDLMVRGRSFYAVWDEEKGLWSTDEYDVQRLVDEDLRRYNAEHKNQYIVLDLQSFSTKVWSEFRKYMMNISDNHHALDSKLVFANTDVKKSDYASQRLSYNLEAGDISAWKELTGVLYSPEELDKIEWAIGSIVAGVSKNIQKFFVFYGSHGTGKSTILNIIEAMFNGYAVTFDAKALGSNGNAFATEVFQSNPLVAIQHDGDLSNIVDNTKLNSIVSHEEMSMNAKYKAIYQARVNALLFMGTNQPVKITDAKSGLIRRLIDIHPTGATIEPKRYADLMTQITFEYGAIAHYCLEKFNEMGKNYYNSYRPIEMMLQTDIFYNYVEYAYGTFKAQNGTSLRQAYELYKEFCDDTGIDRKLPMYKFREELRNYFEKFEERAEVDGTTVRSYYSGFKKPTPPTGFVPDVTYQIELGDAAAPGAKETGFTSVLDTRYADMPAQYANTHGKPKVAWSEVTTTLKDLDTTRQHYVKIPEQHIVIDFDLEDENGEKSLELSLAAASKWPPTYCELSKSGQAVHLHYVYDGDVKLLSSLYDKNIEIKTLLGDASLRRKLTQCNTLDLATISDGLPTKEPSVISDKSIKSEKALRVMIERNLRKEFHAGTKPSVDFIQKILDDAYKDGLDYDVLDMRPEILAFAANSTNQAETCIKTVQKMKFHSEREMPEPTVVDDDAPIVFFDVEVYPNLFVICWKFRGKDEVVEMINPSPQQVEELFNLKLVGYNVRRYDNHILWARSLGYTNQELFELSQQIVEKNNRRVLFGAAYNLSYTDVYDFSSKKQSLKRFQIDLGIFHMELDVPWDQPVPEELWPVIVKYCCNDVISLEAVFEDRMADFNARRILADLSGLSVNHTTQNHTAAIVFGNVKDPQKDFVYTDLSGEFPGYRFDGKESTYRGEITGEGGYVYAEPGMYENVAVLDVASMHPTSTVQLNLFGPYTKRYEQLIQARLAIKRKDRATLQTLLGGKLETYLDGSDKDVQALSYALKIAINIVYGLTSAKFPNPFRDNRNVDNIVAKRGALFMIDLKNMVQEEGFQVVHIKTDSIKIPEATPDIVRKVTEFGDRYGYTFEHEDTYEKFCLVNDAVYIAKTSDGRWSAVGAQFQHPYVFKTLFTHEEITFDDLCETKSVMQGVMYLGADDAERESFAHVGRTGSFVPVKHGGLRLWRIKDDKQYAVTGTKDFHWITREEAEQKKEPWNEWVDFSYFDGLKEAAENAIDYWGSFDRFVS